MVAKKRCNKCKKMIPLVFFWRNLTVPGGRARECKYCRKADPGYRSGYRYA